MLTSKLENLRSHATSLFIILSTYQVIQELIWRP